ncbi:hypothetical protein D3C86_2112780 [compost metagenome]
MKISTAIATFTSGPAIAIANSCPGSSGMRSSLATPPIGRSVMSGVRMPKYRAAVMWPNSCRTTQTKTARIKITPSHAAAVPPIW